MSKIIKDVKEFESVLIAVQMYARDTRKGFDRLPGPIPEEILTLVEAAERVEGRMVAILKEALEVLEKKENKPV